ncbi:hypothetical protein C3R44_22670, partial [Mycobacterium tuberculosis]
RGTEAGSGDERRGDAQATGHAQPRTAADDREDPRRAAGRTARNNTPEGAGRGPAGNDNQGDRGPRSRPAAGTAPGGKPA